MLDEGPDELNELEQLAGVNQKLNRDQDELVISDEGLPEEPHDDGARPSSAGAESSYSDFIQQWKNKLLLTEDRQQQDGPNDDVIS